MDAPPRAHAFEVPHRPSLTYPPQLVHGPEGTALLYPARGDRYFVRVSFEALHGFRLMGDDSPPYPEELGAVGYTGVYLIENSPWLRERIEQRRAGSLARYGEVETSRPQLEAMRTHLEHYLFNFHDESVEVLARGIAFETSRRPFALDAPPKRRPWEDLSSRRVTERFVVAGIRCQVRTHPLPLEELLEQARYCSVPRYQFALEGLGAASVVASLRLRVRWGQTYSLWSGHFSATTTRLPGLVSLEEAKALIEPYIREVAERRREMGK